MKTLSTQDMKTAYFERFELSMPAEAAQDCSHSGRCDEDVAYWQRKIDFTAISDKALRAELKEYGAWTAEELEDRLANERRILWIAACNINDGDYEAE